MVLARENSQTWGNITIIHLCLCHCGVKMTILGVQNGVLARKNGGVSAEIIIHLWVLGRVPVLSDLIHHSSSLGTKVAALTLENDTRPVSFDHGFILGLHRYTS